MNDVEFAEFNRIANAVSDQVGESIIAAAEAAQSPELSAASIFYAAVNGSITAAVRVFHATHKATPFDNPDALFDGMLRQMVDVWGQCRGEPAQTQGTVQ